jgi:three-Cys-motif partner protein
VPDNSFFDETTDQSEVKARLVSKYFWSWAQVVMPSAQRFKGGRIAYIDLFAGPGRYKDGTKSTPLLILERAIQDDTMRRMLVSMFNDVNEDNSRSLEQAISQLPGVELLQYPPHVRNEEVGEQIVQMFEGMKLIPTLFFVDPWGYKGLSLRLVNAVLKHWGCDCIFFFNYNRINMGLGNDLVREHMNALFGEERADRLRPALLAMSRYERELTIVNEIAEALREMGGKYVLPFGFRNAEGFRTSHHLIFVSKHQRGYGIMKDIMARESSNEAQGVPSFEYNPASERQPMLFEYARPLDDLGGMLLEAFAGKTLPMKQIYEQHNVGTRYVERNYKDVLRRMESQGDITVDPTANRRKHNHGEVTFGPNVQVTFPAR